MNITLKDLKNFIEKNTYFKRGDIIVNFNNRNIFKYEDEETILNEVFKNIPEHKVKQWICSQWYILPSKYLTLFEHYKKNIIKFSDFDIHTHEQIRQLKNDCADHKFILSSIKKAENKDSEIKEIDMQRVDAARKLGEGIAYFLIIGEPISLNFPGKF